MLLLGTTDSIRLITGAAADIDVYTAFVDNNSGTVTVQPPQETAGIATATTTTIVSAPGAGIRNVKYINITNNSSAVPCQVEVEFFNGTDAVELRGVTLLAGENLAMDANCEWHHRDAQNAEYAYTANPNQNLGPTGCLAETIPREICPETNTTVGASGTLVMMAIKLQAGLLVSTIDLWSATTAAGTPTNYNVGLYDQNRNLLAQGTNKTTEAWAANSLKSFAMQTAVRAPYTGLYYIGYYMAATTIVTLKGGPTRTGGQLQAAVPALYGTSNTGLTTTLPNPANAITTVNSGGFYAAIR